MTVARALSGLAAPALNAPGRRAAPGAGQGDAGVLWRIDGAEALPQVPFVALAPGSDAPLLPVTLPAQLRGPAREAVARRQICDRLGVDAAALAVRPARLGVSGARWWQRSTSQDWSAVLVVDQDDLDRWRTAIAPRQGACRAVLPDYLALPAAPGVWTVHVEPASGDAPARVTARLGVRDGFAAEPDLAALLLTRARARTGAPAALLRTGPAMGQLDTALADIPVSDHADRLPASVARPVRFGHGELALDLADDVQARRAVMRARLAALRLPLALALAGTLAWSASMLVEATRLHEQAELTMQEVHDLVRRDFLPTGPLLDIRVQVARELDRRRGALAPPDDSTPPLRNLVHAAQVLHARGAQVQAIGLRAGTDTAVDVILSDFAALDAVLAALQTAGLSARASRSGTAPGGGVAATLLLGGGQ